MIHNNLYIGENTLHHKSEQVTGKYVTLEDEEFYKISHYNQMPAFFMSIVSDSDHWMFISSNGALSAGRKNPDNALFPYYTDDRIHDSNDITGSKTILWISKDGKSYLWEPFSNNYNGIYIIERNIYKNITGNKIIFEEINRGLSIIFRYAWLNSGKFGFIKKSTLANTNSEKVIVDIVDGIQNILPYGIDRRFQLEYSTLADGYKKNELQQDTGLGLFSMSSIPTDKAEPSEALKTTTVWSTGLENSKILISTRQLDAFKKGEPPAQESDVRAARGAYFLYNMFTLATGEKKDWYLVAVINQDAADVAMLAKLLQENRDLKQQVEEDIQRGTENLIKIVANADGLQVTKNKLATSRHFSNVLFNVMRGGIFDHDYSVEISDFTLFIKSSNTRIFQDHHHFLKTLPHTINYNRLLEQITDLKDTAFEKLCYEYLPLTFSRRHGDPSRPWNMFSIEIKDEQGQKILNYQGNWRDIFQNWEALALSFPNYIESMISKFVNASTADGYNPYRVTRDGFDWEVLDPSDSWSYIGYWGDHQIIYLLKLLELSMRYHPGQLHILLTKNMFAYANVPYRIKPYGDLLTDPKNTIDFDEELDHTIAERVKTSGTDAKFIALANGEIYFVNLTEKLLVTVLSKLANFIPEAGIWMNTQRPEWNDANNALVGYGVSMVTLYYLRRFLTFAKTLFGSLKLDEIAISNEVAGMFDRIHDSLVTHKNLVQKNISDKERKTIIDSLGQAGSDYRNTIYTHGFSEKKIVLPVTKIMDFYDIALSYLDHSIKANKRTDNLYHAYNLIKVENNHEISIRNLYEMVEGQVAVLSSGYCSAKESLAVLDALRKSALYREDQNSYILYPNRQLLRFVEKNNIPSHLYETSELLQMLIKIGNKQIVIKDALNRIHFSGVLRNARLLSEALDTLGDDKLKTLVEKEKQVILNIYESVFDHQSFTGRSGTFYKYEGLGCIYWHMISKLVLAVQETCLNAEKTGAEPAVISRLKEHYYQIQAGIGVTKSPQIYGAFPTDPYSHTPGYSGVQQPGMTGQVKEDILSRFGELGIRIEQGTIRFATQLLKKDEFLTEPTDFLYYDVNGARGTLKLQLGMLAFTICQVPVVYILSEASNLVITNQDGSVIESRELIIDKSLSSVIFERRNIIQKIEVFLDKNSF
jgi:hypothetical protein